MISGRRSFIKKALSSGLILGLPVNFPLTLYVDPEGKASNDKTHKNDQFYIIEKRAGKYLFLTPDKKPFFSIGFNHIDPAPLRYNENLFIWEEKYNNSMEKWLKAVRKDLIAWGFNSVGWVQDVVVRGETMRRHSRNFSFEEYQYLDMPYFHMLPFADFHQWDVEVRNPDFFSKEFEEWCDYVGRDQCARLANDKKLIGYFFLDCPTWVHNSFPNPVKGPIMDPEISKTEAGRKELFRIADRYYKVTMEAVKRYDKNHLILGDRYEAKALISEEVVRAACQYVDVLSFQHFASPEEILSNLKYWHELTGKPTLLADFSHNERIEGTDYMKHNTLKYAQTLEFLSGEPSCVGMHLCGAYLANRSRRRGILDENENYTYPEFADIISANKEAAKHVIFK